MFAGRNTKSEYCALNSREYLLTVKILPLPVKIRSIFRGSAYLLAFPTVTAATMTAAVTAATMTAAVTATAVTAATVTAATVTAATVTAATMTAATMTAATMTAATMTAATMTAATMTAATVTAATVTATAVTAATMTAATVTAATMTAATVTAATVTATAVTAVACAAVTAVTAAGVVSAMTAVVSVASVTTPADINKDSTTGPVPAAPAPAPPDRSDRYGSPKSEQPKCSEGYPWPNGEISEGRIRWIRPGPVNNCRVVSGHINNIRISGCNLDGFTCDGHLLLWGRLEIAGGISFLPQSLNRCRDIGLLRHESLAQLCCPPHLPNHHVEYLREGRQRLNALVPLHLLQGLIERVPRKARVCLHPLVRCLNISWICSRDKDLCDQRIRVERNRRKHLVKLSLAECLVRS